MPLRPYTAARPVRTARVRRMAALECAQAAYVDAVAAAYPNVRHMLADFTDAGYAYMREHSARDTGVDDAARDWEAGWQPGALPDAVPPDALLAVLARDDPAAYAAQVRGAAYSALNALMLANPLNAAGDTLLYRGVYGHGAAGGARVGDVVEYGKLLSASRDAGVASTFTDAAGCCLLQLRVPHGYPRLAIAGYSQAADERETVLPARLLRPECVVDGDPVAQFERTTRRFVECTVNAAWRIVARGTAAYGGRVVETLTLEPAERRPPLCAAYSTHARPTTGQTPAMTFVYQVPAGLEPADDARVAARLRAASADTDAYLRTTGANEPGAVRFALRWADGTERDVVVFLGRVAFVYDAATRVGAAAEQGEPVRALTVQPLAPREGVDAGRVLGPLLGAAVVADLYGSRAAADRRDTQRALLVLAAGAARRPLDESERRAALSLVLKLAADNEAQVRRMAGLLYPGAVPDRAAMRNFVRAGVRPLPDAKRARTDDGDDDDDDDDDSAAPATDGAAEVARGDADGLAGTAQLVVERLFNLVGNDPGARAALQLVSRRFAATFGFASPERERDAYMRAFPALARVLGDELPSWMSDAVDRLPLGRLQRAVEAFAVALRKRAGTDGAALARGAAEPLEAFRARQAAVAGAWRRALTLLERLNGRLRVDELPAALRSDARARRTRQWSYFRAALDSAVRHPALRARLPSALRAGPRVRAELRHADELLEPRRRAEAASDDRDTYTAREQIELPGPFLDWPHAGDGRRATQPQLEGLHYVAVHDAADDIWDYPAAAADRRFLAGAVMRSQLLAERREFGVQRVPEPVVVYAGDVPRQLDPRSLYYPLLQQYVDGYARALLVWADGARLDRGVARVAGAVEWLSGWRRALAYAPADVTLLCTLLRVAKGELAVSPLLRAAPTEAALREQILRPSIAAEIDQMLADGEFSSDEEAGAVLEAQLADASETALVEERTDALMFAVLDDAAFGERVVRAIERRAAELFVDRRPDELAAALLRHLYTALLLRHLLIPIEFDLSPAIERSFVAGGAPPAFARWERRAEAALTERVGRALLVDPLFANQRDVEPARRAETLGALRAEVDALHAAAITALGIDELTLLAPLAGAAGALHELVGARPPPTTPTGARGEKRSKMTEPASADTDEPLFYLVANVFEADALGELRELYRDVAARAAAPPGARPAPEYQAQERGVGRLDVDLGEPVVDFTRMAAIRITAVIGAETLASAVGAADVAEWIYDAPHALVTLRGAAAQSWHTDIEPLCGDEDDEPRCDYYFTLLVNIGERAVTRAQGPTEFARADDDGNVDEESIERPLLEPNQGVLFSGAAMHRGGAARAAREPTVYITLRRRWYRDLNREQFDLIDVNL